MSNEILCVQIGNTDDKLSQAMWAGFITDVQQAVSVCADIVYFCGASYPDRVWQNHCWVFSNRWGDAFRDRMAQLCGKYGQDSIAIMSGTTEFITRSFEVQDKRPAT